MKIKRIIALILLLTFFAGCKSEKTTENVSFLINESDIFPFYSVDKDGILWKTENNGGTCLFDKVDYSIGGETVCFTKKLSKNQLVYATDIRTENGKILCTLKEQKLDEDTKVIFENAEFDSVKVDTNGNVLFLDKDKNLYLRRKEMLNNVAKNVAQAEFNNNGLLIYRTDDKNQNGEYPVYSLDGDNLTYLTDGEKIVCSKDGNGYILKNIHNLQRRTLTIQVATCSCILDGEARYEIENVVLSQFENDICGNYLIFADTEQILLRFGACYLKSGTDGQPKEIVSMITAGKTLDENVFFCQKEENGQTVTYMIREDNVIQIKTNCELSRIYNADNRFLSVYDGKAFDIESGECISETDQVNTFAEMGDYYVYSSENDPPYNLSVVMNNEEDTVILDRVASLNIKKIGDRLFFLTGENGQSDLNMYDISEKSITAITSNVDEKAGFLCADDMVAVAKKDDGTLFLAGVHKAVDCGIKISRIV